MNDVSLFPKHVSNIEKKGQNKFNKKKADQGNNKNAPQEVLELNQWLPEFLMAVFCTIFCMWPDHWVAENNFLTQVLTKDYDWQTSNGS